ncbi:MULTISPECIES: cytochrome c oxidase assembly protein [unclassified Streptomyces]|uniref:cytochrome c oxidase assembly protein n=1 Tax=unclassified Streptomyces TaxID=2593676 RepID=UPI003419D0D3
MSTEPMMTRRARLPMHIGAVMAASVTAALAALWFGGGTAQPVAGIEDAGKLTALGLPVARTVMDAAAVATVGALLLIAVLLAGRHVRLSETQRRYLVWAAVAGALWAAAAAVTLVFTVSDLFAQPVGQFLSLGLLADFIAGDAQGRAYAVVVVGGVTLAVLTPGISTARGAWWALVFAVGALLPPAFTGHSSAAANHDAAVVSLALHLIGVALWVGGLAFVLVLAVRREDAAAGAARRFSGLAGWALLSVAASGLLNAAVRLPSLGDLFTERYGLLVLAKAAALTVLGWCGRLHRRRTLHRLDAGGPRPFVHLAVGELLVMAVAMGLAVGLSRTPAPSGADAPYSAVRELLGYSMPAPLGGFPWTPLFTAWRFDVVFALGCTVLALLYLAGVRKLRRRGDAWPVGRTISWLLGLVVTVFTTMGGLSTYGKVLFSVHMGQHMILAMTVPILLVLGAPITLALRALPAAGKGERRGTREALLSLLHSRYISVMSHPVVAGVLFIGSAFAVYYTPLFVILMRSHLGHLAMQVHFLAVGLLFFWVIIGIDPGPRRPPYLAKLFVLMLAMPFHSWFSISLMSSADIIGEDWWTALGRTWGPSLADEQYNAGAIAWATGDIPVLITTIILAIQWVRSDAREARRIDRTIDRGDGKDPLTAYNAYLAALHSRTPEPEPAQRSSDLSARRNTP